MFSSIVVPLDLETRSDRALPIAGALAAKSGIPIELVTVSSPQLSEASDAYELEQRGRATGAAWSTTVLHDDDPAAALVAFLTDRPGALVVMATRARTAFGELLLGSVTEDVLRHSDHPVLLVGPHASVEDPPAAPTLVAGVDGRPASMSVLGAVASWHEAFDGPRPWLVEVLPVPKEPTDFGDVAESSDVHRLATDLKEMGVAAEWEVTRAKHPSDALIDFADQVVDAVIVVASSRWTDAQHSHLHSVARRLAHEAHHPVLVVRANDVPSDERAHAASG